MRNNIKHTNNTDLSEGGTETKQLPPLMSQGR